MLNSTMDLHFFTCIIIIFIYTRIDNNEKTSYIFSMLIFDS
jgi:hypothetical protein